MKTKVFEFRYKERKGNKNAINAKRIKSALGLYYPLIDWIKIKELKGEIECLKK